MDPHSTKNNYFALIFILLEVFNEVDSSPTSKNNLFMADLKCFLRDEN